MGFVARQGLIGTTSKVISKQERKKKILEDPFGETQKALVSGRIKPTVEETEESKIARGKKFTYTVTKPSGEVVERTTITTPTKTGTEIRVINKPTTTQQLVEATTKPTKTLQEIYLEGQRVSVQPGKEITKPIRDESGKIVGYTDPVRKQTIVARKQKETGGTFISSPEERELTEAYYYQQTVPKTKEPTPEKSWLQERIVEPYRTFEQKLGIKVLPGEESDVTFRTGVEQFIKQRREKYVTEVGGLIVRPKKVGELLQERPSDQLILGSYQTLKGTGAKVRSELRDKPITYTALFTASAVVPAAIGGVKLAAVKYVPSAIRTATVVKVGGSVTGAAIKYGVPAYYGVTVTKRLKEEPDPYKKGEIIGKEGLFIGTMYAGYKFGTKFVAPIEYQITFEKGLQKLPHARQVKARAEFKELKAEFKSVKKGALKHPRNIDWKQIERLPESLRKPTKQFFVDKRDELIVGGSVAQRTGVPKPSKLSISHDIDVYSDDPNLVKELAKFWRSSGFKDFRVVSKKIYVGGYGKAIEFHPATKTGAKLYYGWKDPAAKGFIYEKTFDTVAGMQGYGSTFARTPSGIHVTKLKYQAARKLYGGFEVEVTKTGVARLGRYTKDIPSYKEIVAATKKPPQVGYKFKTLSELGKKASIPLTGQTISVTRPDTGKVLDVYKTRVTPKGNYVSSSYYSSSYYVPQVSRSPSLYPVFRSGKNYVSPARVVSEPRYVPPPVDKSYPTVPVVDEPRYVPPPPFEPDKPYVPSPTDSNYRVTPPTDKPYITPVPTKTPYPSIVPPPTQVTTAFKPPAPVRFRRDDPFRGGAFAFDIRRGGKWITKRTGLSREGALGLGSQAAVSSLAASFRIRPVAGGVTSRAGEGLFSKYRNQFRDYKISKGQRVPLQDIYIQKRGKRLGTRSEVSEIQLARRMRLR